MKQGNWVPIDKRAIKFIPDDRPFSKAEALLSLQVAYDCKQDVSVSRFCKLWKWSNRKVMNFIKEIGVEFDYLGDKRGQKKARVRHKLRTSEAQLTFLDNKGSKEVKHKSSTSEAQVKHTGIKTKTKTKTKTKEKTFLSDSNEYRLAEFLFLKICERSPNHKKPNLQTWALHIDYILRIDKKPYDEILKLIEWVQMDSFWQDNILSTSKLREKYEQLFLKMNSNGKNNKLSKAGMKTAAACTEWLKDEGWK